MFVFLDSPDIAFHDLPQTCASGCVGLYVYSNFRILLVRILFQPLDNPDKGD